MLERDQGRSQAAGAVPWPLYPVCRAHLDAMSTGVGLWQHALGSAPAPEFGYCTDDVARALVVDALHSRELGWAAVNADAGRSVRFLAEAFDAASGRFLNFRSAEGAWLTTGASQDCHARALVGLAATFEAAPDSEPGRDARRLFETALPAVESFDAIRAIAAAILACDAAVDAGEGLTAEPVLRRLAERLDSVLGNVSGDWPWSEPLLTYETAVVPRSLIAAGRRLNRDDLVRNGCRVLDWLIEVQTSGSGLFSPVGNAGWWRRGEEPSHFDQQPIEAATIIDAADTAYRATGRRRYIDAAETAYGWFLGANDVGVPVAIPVTGGCQDGLSPRGPNANQGAESTLMWLTALERIRGLRRSGERRAARRAEPAHQAGRGR